MIIDSSHHSVLDLFKIQVEKNPENIAIVFDNKELTYYQLDKEVTSVQLLILKYAKNERIIGLPTTRGIDSIIFLLAILKSGKAYLPLDLDYPTNRLQNIINNSKLLYCLSNNHDENSIQALGLNLVKENSVSSQNNCSQDILSENAAYILYTSGSTGEPKGVCMGHKAVLNLIKWQNKNSKSTRGSRTLQFAPLTFDVSFQEIMATLTSGSTLVLINEDLRLDMVALLHFIKEQGVNRLFLPFVALQALAEAAISTGEFPNTLNEIMTAGEQLKITPQLITFFTSINNCFLYNQYGPTECHVVTQLKLDGDPSDWETLPTIGTPIDNTSIFILDEKKELLQKGKSGDLYIAGDCLANGYLNNEQLTNEKFLDWKSPEGILIRVYHSGDIAKYREDGTIQFLGRKDDQVKISGHRIELAEVELAINSLKGIHQTVVIASNHTGETQLVAYIQPNDGMIDVAVIRKHIGRLLPAYMIPSNYILVDNFPRTASGKIDKKNLPAPIYSRPTSAPLYQKATTEIQKNITKVWTNLLHIPQIGINDNFFDMGGTSLLAQKLVATLLKEYNYKVSVIKLYQFPTIAKIASYIASNNQNKSSESTKSVAKLHSTKVSNVAIIGMAGRFPGAQTIAQLWDVLKNGKETISFFEPEELDANIPESLRKDPLYVRARGIIPNANTFDAAFFGINPKLAEVMDPQFRLFLEIAWETLEQTGYLPKHYNGPIGVYAGVGANTYYKKNILPNQEVLDRVGYLQAETVNEKDYISSRTAYHLNLKGPAVSVFSACSTSLLAIAQAVEAIRSGQCKIALAGGSSVTAPIFSGHLYQEGSMLSSDGHCRSFDADAKGTVFSDGAGIVLLKSLEAAQKDGDTIYGVIKGIGINNDGGNKGSFTAPSTEGQANAIAKAMGDAQVAPETISYVETHGTATPLGDPIEIEGLKLAFGDQPTKGSTAIGSIKSNMGHLTAAAGVAGLIKTVLAMNQKLLPPSLGFDKPNPIIDFENSPFFVNTTAREWKSNTNLPLRAGVSSFGVGGTNVHLVVEDYIQEPKISGLSRPEQLVLWSAKTVFSATGYQKELGTFLESNATLSLADVAYSLQKTRDTFAHRQFVVESSTVTTAATLLSIQNKKIKAAVLKAVPSELVFLFPGQGSQYLQMGMQLYQNEKTYTETIDRCATLLLKDIEVDIRSILYPEHRSPEAEAQLKDTRFTQPALFVTEYALAQLWMSWGVHPTAICGHSIGEFVGGVIAGIFSLEDALHLIALRGKLVSELPTGSMLSVRMNEEELLAILPNTLSLAAVNSRLLCVVAGEADAIASFSKKLDHAEIANKLLFTSHAFHSHMMDPAVAAFETAVQQIQLQVPNLPIASSVTGKWLTDEEATNPRYWSEHMRKTVRYSPAAKTLLELEDPTFIEVGPGQTLTALTKQQGTGTLISAFASLPVPKENGSDYQSLLTTLGELWLRGFEPDWKAFYKDQQRQLIALPSYVFDRKPCWIDPPNVAIKNTPEELKQSSYSEDPIAIEPKKDIRNMRKITILNQIATAINQTSGVAYPADASSYSFLELGLDSLTLTQLAIRLKKEFKLPISFRQLNEALNTPDLVADYFDANLPQETITQPLQVAPAPQAAPLAAPVVAYTPTPIDPQNNTALGLIAQQIQLLGKQIELLRGVPVTQNTAPIQEAAQQLVAPIGTTKTKEDKRTATEIAEHQKPFGASPKIDKQSNSLTSSQKEFIDQLIPRYTQKTAASKEYAQKNRSIMADPRVVTGFKPLTKEMVYPIVIEKSSGNQLWDLDGNQYLDALNGFGSCFFGHQPGFIKEALHQQIESGFEVGPQHPLAAEVCELLLGFTNHDRAALCNTGSEAVLGAMRIARTYTGRSLIVAFTGSYHGINDEALVRGSKQGMSFPAAAGIMPETVQNMLILDYGTDESLRIIADRADEIAAVLVEPVQSRRPEFQPIAYLKQLRSLTEQHDIALIFDEVITGFRSHLGGAQALFGIEADIATYGKVIGGGISIGAILGKRKYLDTLDGGQWQFGDDSVPEIGVTYFAGTFVRHPLALASCKAALLHLKKQGPALQDRLTGMTNRLASTLNIYFTEEGLPMVINHFSSLWRLKFNEDIQHSDLLFTLLRENGIHIMDGFPCFLTEPYEEKDIDYIITTIKICLSKMVAAGFCLDSISSVLATDAKDNTKLNTPPVPNAKLGRDLEGNPAWFVKKSENTNEYLKIDLQKN